MKKSACLLLALLISSTCAAQLKDPSLQAAYIPITGQERLEWFADSTAGPTSLLMSGPVVAGWGTWRNSPEEYGPHWEGFGKRYGIRLSGVATNNAIEASLGAIWDEDPRFFPAKGKPFGKRVKHIISATFTASGRDGRYRPAYARYAAMAGGNVLSNAWRVDSETDWQSTLIRPTTGLLGRMASNALSEFWPDVKRKLFKK
jgi:hypothetical protein